jgi:hypothetical protein
MLKRILFGIFGLGWSRWEILDFKIKNYTLYQDVPSITYIRFNVTTGKVEFKNVNLNHLSYGVVELISESKNKTTITWDVVMDRLKEGSK